MPKVIGKLRFLERVVPFLISFLESLCCKTEAITSPHLQGSLHYCRFRSVGGCFSVIQRCSYSLGRQCVCRTSNRTHRLKTLWDLSLRISVEKYIGLVDICWGALHKYSLDPRTDSTHIHLHITHFNNFTIKTIHLPTMHINNTATKPIHQGQAPPTQSHSSLTNTLKQL